MKLDKALQQKLGRELREIFSDVADEPVPERFQGYLDDDPPPFSGAPGMRPPQPIRKLRVYAARR